MTPTLLSQKPGEESIPEAHATFNNTDGPQMLRMHTIVPIVSTSQRRRGSCRQLSTSSAKCETASCGSSHSMHLHGEYVPGTRRALSLTNMIVEKSIWN